MVVRACVQSLVASTPSIIRNSASPVQNGEYKQSMIISCESGAGTSTTNSSNVSRTHLVHSSLEEGDWLPSLTEHPSMKPAEPTEAAAPAVRLNHRYGFSD